MKSGSNDFFQSVFLLHTRLEEFAPPALKAKRLFSTDKYKMNIMKRPFTQTLGALALTAALGAIAHATPARPDAGPRPMTRVYQTKVPAALFNVSEDSEDLYDQAFASNWSQAKTALTKISRDTATLRKTQPSLGQRSAQLAALAVAVQGQIAAHNRAAALREINAMTRLTIEMGAAYAAPIPVAVSLLDYYGRELQVWAVAGDKARLQSTLNALQMTWQRVRPQVVARKGGARAAQSFDAMVSRARAAKSSSNTLEVAAPLLEEVDRLENVFGA